MSALQGIRVLDLSRLLPGPFATQLLVDLGAEVIKIEDPQGGDYLRHMPPQLEDGACVVFHALNRGKKSVCLDLKDAADRGRFLALVRTADVVVESFRPGVLDKLGLAPASLREANPRLVVCSISGYGQAEGPYRLKAGHDVNYLSRAGALGMMREPTLLPVQVADLAGGALPAALQICAALVGRARSGQGALIDVSMTHNVFGLLSTSFARKSAAAEDIGGGRDLLVGRVPCYGVYPCADGFISVGSLEPKFWYGLCAALELPSLRDRGMDSGEEGDEVRAILAERFRTKTRAEWTALIAAHDVCVEAVRTPEEALADPGFQSVEVLVEGRAVRLPVPAIGLAGAEPSTVCAPKLGEHTMEVLGRL
jgi:alpha-methylacyl-CoA racemase